jgi:hypothetical protein
MKYSEIPVSWRTIAAVPVLLALIAVTAIVNPFSSYAKLAYDTPTLNCGSSSQTSINVVVTAGPSGAPAGFTVQWVTAAALAANNGAWPATSCGASFSGQANGSRYDLGAGESVTVTIGDILSDAGASVDPGCGIPLVCGTDYAFRVFAHADNSHNASQKSDPIICSTLPCGHDIGGCTLTQGYWKTHNDTVCATNPNSPLCVIWPVHDLTLGTVNYNQAQLLAILNQTPAGGNGLVSLAHQLIAAKLNIANGASSTPGVDSAIAAADALIGAKVVPPVGTGSLPPSSTGPLVTVLDQYNNGFTGPGHCD